MEPHPIPPTPSGPDHSAARALARVGWTKVWARLLRYATSVLRLAAMDAESAGVVEAGDLVGALFEKSRAGTKVRKHPEFLPYLRIMREEDQG